MFKRAKVVMLPTNEKAIRPLLINPSTDKMEIPKHAYDYPASEYQKVGYKTVYLYFLSDEEIKEGDWIYRRKDGYKTIQKATLPLNLTSVNKKIIATTDTSLTEKIEMLGTGSTYIFNLPQPSQSFIEKFVEEYNKGNVITEVMVEYNLMNKGYDKPEDYPYQECEILKVNSKDNTITIRKMKDSWNREEVIKLINKISEEVDFESATQKTIDKWIEENL